MRLRRVHHVSLNVDDLDAALQFYNGALGMPLIPRPDFGFPGAWLDAGEQEVHLIEVGAFDAPKGQHVAFEVEDVAAASAELEAGGVQVTPSRELDGVCVQAFFSDPAGNLIEITQPLG